ncbi:MAG: (Fe-S)-binding protein [Desulfovibrio sp.]|jgi:glycolate oxidase iron-sulfur subunit|nr:(Fe-S)-binding protein [Desulfovibrio sp.]
MAEQRGCTQCGACVNACPVFRHTRREEYSPKAKQGVLAFADKGEPGLDPKKCVALAGRCVCCERCLLACPRNLSVPEALSKARQRRPRLGQYFWREWIRRGAVAWPLAAKAAPLAPGVLLPERLRILRASALAMTPPPRAKPWLTLEVSRMSKRLKTVIFGGCTATRLRPVWMKAADGILEKLGTERCSASGFTCCGGTYAHAGMLESSREAAKINLAWWRGLGKPAVVVFCASCVHSLRRYAQMGIMDRLDAREWLNAVTPLSTLLGGAKATLTNNAPSVPVYHSPCHWGDSDPDFVWLKSVLPEMVKGVSLCCGFGGVMKLLEPLLSADLASACWKGMEDGSPGHVSALTGCGGCVLQLAAHAPEHGGKAHEIRHWLDCIA